MSTFNFDSQSVTDAGSIARSFHDSVYPNNEIRVKNTSNSLNGISRMRTLTTRNLSEAISGDVLFTSLKSTNVAMNQLMDSSLNNALTGFSEAGFTTNNSYSIPNPDNTDTETKLTGGMAVARNLHDSIAGRKLMDGFTRRAAQSISSDYSTYSSYPQAPAQHSDTGYVVDGGSLGAGSRTVVLDANLSSSEKTWLTERANVLKNTGMLSSNDGSLVVSGYDFNIPDHFETLYTTKTRFPNIEDSSTIAETIIKAPLQKAYVCPALIELLIFLSSKLQISGGFGLQRANSPDDMASNNGTLTEGSSITDHALGRGFDIMGVGYVGQTMHQVSDGGTNVDVYRTGLEVLLTVISSAPSHLIPDFMAISSSLRTEYGILDEGFEEETVAIKTKYPALKYVNFHADNTHRNHIHMSFSGGRSGIYVGPGGAMATGGVAVPSGGVTPPATGYEAEDRRFAGIAAGTSPGSGGTSGDSSSSDYYSRLGEINTTIGAGENNGYVPPTNTETSAVPAGNAFLTFIRKTLLENPFAVLLSDGSATSTSGSAIGAIALTGDLSDPKYTTNYSNDTSFKLSGEEIFKLLSLTIMSAEACSFFCVVTKRESGARPAALNITRGSDWSIGMFQISLRPGSNGHGSKLFYLPMSGRQEYGWKLGFKDWQSAGVNEGNFETKAYDLYDTYNADGNFNKISLVDPELCVPITQAYMLYPTITSTNFSGTKLGESPETGYIFFPWGDYGKAKGNGYFTGQPYGWITGIRFDDAVVLYESVGGTRQQLKQWILDVYKTPSASGQRSAQYIEDWVEGYYFPGTLKEGGWFAEPPQEP